VDLKMEIGKRIKKIRNDKSMKQEEFGVTLGVNRQAISRLESGRQVVDQDLLNNLWVQFKVSPHWLITGEDPGAVVEVAKLKSDLKETKRTLSLVEAHRDSLTEIIQLLKDAAGINK
jgi:transcriptional regulator with XRE-family HTH domain